MWSRVITVASISFFVYYFFLRDRADPEILKGKRVVITGASRGFGEQLAYYYAKHGADVFITARTEERLKKVVTQCEKLGEGQQRSMYHPTDMSDLAAVDLFFKEVESRFGGVDTLVLNHALAHPFGPWIGSAENHTYLDLIMDVNLKSHVHLTSHALPLLKSSRGHIVVISSISGKIGQPYTTAYSATKAALGAFFDSLRAEQDFQESPIAITQVVLGLIGTETAIENMRRCQMDRILDLNNLIDPADAASEVIRSSLSHPREVYFPYWQQLSLTMLRDILPGPIAYLHRVLLAM